jgi:hypothetical protein
VPIPLPMECMALTQDAADYLTKFVVIGKEGWEKTRRTCPLVFIRSRRCVVPLFLPGKTAPRSVHARELQMREGWLCVSGDGSLLLSHVAMSD